MIEIIHEKDPNSKPEDESTYMIDIICDKLGLPWFKEEQFNQFKKEYKNIAGTEFELDFEDMPLTWPEGTGIEEPEPPQIERETRGIIKDRIKTSLKTLPLDKLKDVFESILAIESSVGQEEEEE